MKKKVTNYPSVDQSHKDGEHFSERHPIIPSISIYGALSLMSRSCRNDIAISCHDFNATFSYLLRDATKISFGLKALGICSGQIITICMPKIK